MTVDQLPGYLKQHWPTIRAHLLNGNYKPQPVKRVEIPKPDGGVRKLGVPTVLDRFIQQAVMQQKSAVARPWERKFLGFSFTSGPEPRRRIAPKALIRFKKRVRELTQRTRGISIEEMASQLGRYLHGWHGYFGACQTPSVLKELDQWIRRRLRSFLWKQWKRGPERYAELTRRGVGKDLRTRSKGVRGPS
jgi:RNA-directed DNA polymerase